MLISSSPPSHASSLPPLSALTQPPPVTRPIVPLITVLCTPCRTPIQTSASPPRTLCLVTELFACIRRPCIRSWHHGAAPASAAQSLQLRRRRRWTQTPAPPQLTQKCLWRLCSQMLDQPQALQWLLMRLRSQMDLPPHLLHRSDCKRGRPLSEGQTQGGLRSVQARSGLGQTERRVPADCRHSGC